MMVCSDEAAGDGEVLGQHSETVGWVPARPEAAAFIPPETRKTAVGLWAICRWAAEIVAACQQPWLLQLIVLFSNFRYSLFC